MAKKITILPKTNNEPEIALEFTTRGPGEETPYYQGLIHAKNGQRWEKVGYFSNNGCGGMTNVDGMEEAGKKAVNRMVEAGKEAATLHGTTLMEPEGDMVAWAEMIGYTLKCSAEAFTLADYVAYSGCAPYWPNRTEKQRAAFEAANIKMENLEAQPLIKKGKTVVFCKKNGHQWTLVFHGCNDPEVIAEEMKKKEYTEYRIAPTL